jgi:hypothetical protein
MKTKWLILIGVLLMGALVACSPATGGEASVPASGDKAAVGTGVEITEDSGLSTDYNGALSIQGQLAVGTLLLEETELAVDEALAANLLPLWQAVQSLSNSDTAADIEIEAVLNQIQDTMTQEQISAIVEMGLTEDSLTTMLEEGELAFGAGGFGRGSGDNTGEGGEGFRPGGVFPGGGVPGGGGPGGGQGGRPGGGLEGVDPDAIATRQAQFAEGDAGAFQDMAMTGAVVRLLGTKTGEISADGPARIFEVGFDVISEATGLRVEDIRAQTAEGVPMAEIVEANGGDVETVYTALVKALGELPNAGDLVDIEALASQWLGLDQ